MFFRCLIFLLGLYSTVAFADAYRCFEGGRVTISNTPCAATKVIRSDDQSPESVQQAHNDVARQRQWLQQREYQNQKNNAIAQRQAQDVDRMFPNRPEPANTTSSSITAKGCGFGGSCPTTRTTTR